VTEFFGAVCGGYFSREGFTLVWLFFLGGLEGSFFFLGGFWGVFVGFLFFSFSLGGFFFLFFFLSFLLFDRIRHSRGNNGVPARSSHIFSLPVAAPQQLLMAERSDGHSAPPPSVP